MKCARSGEELSRNRVCVFWKVNARAHVLSVNHALYYVIRSFARFAFHALHIIKHFTFSMLSLPT